MSIRDSYDRKMGKFFIKQEFLEDHPNAVKTEVLDRTMIVRAEYFYAQGGIEYTAYCHDFDMVTVGSTCPTYIPILDSYHKFLRWERLL